MVFLLKVYENKNVSVVLCKSNIKKWWKNCLWVRCRVMGVGMIKKGDFEVRVEWNKDLEWGGRGWEWGGCGPLDSSSSSLHTGNNNFNSNKPNIIISQIKPTPEMRRRRNKKTRIIRSQLSKIVQKKITICLIIVVTFANTFHTLIVTTITGQRQYNSCLLVSLSHNNCSTELMKSIDKCNYNYEIDMTHHSISLWPDI